MMGYLGRRRFGRRFGFRGLRGLGVGGGRFTGNLKDVAIGAVGGGAGLILENYADALLPAAVTPGMRIGFWGVAGVLAGTFLTRVNRSLGIGLGAAMGGAALRTAVTLVTSPAGMSAYKYSGRYGMHGYPYSFAAPPYTFAGQPSGRYPQYGWGMGTAEPSGPRPYAGWGMGAAPGGPRPYAGWGIGRTRVADWPAYGRELMGLGRTRVADWPAYGRELMAYQYSGRYGMHG